MEEVEGLEGEVLPKEKLVTTATRVKSPKKPVVRRKLLRPKQFKIANGALLQKILNPPPKPQPEFQGAEYITGVQNELNLLYMCSEPHCEAKFTTQLGLNIHMTKHLNRCLKCPFCRMLFKTRSDLNQHQEKFHPDLKKFPDANPLQCKICAKISRDVKALWRHVSRNHQDKRWLCPHCNFPFVDPDTLKRHVIDQHPEDGVRLKHACKICGKEYLHRGTLNGHIRRIHRGGSLQTFRCVICKTSYSCKQSYTSHMKRHVNPTFYPCHICAQKFRSESHLKRHRSSQYHAIQEKAAKCKSKLDLCPAPVIKSVSTAINPNLSKEELIELCRRTEVKIVVPKVDGGVVTKPHLQRPRKKRDLPKRKRGRPKKIVEGGYDSDSDMEEGSSMMPTLPPQVLTNTNNQKVPTTGQGQYLNCLYCDKNFADLSAVKWHEKSCPLNGRNKQYFICSVCNKEFDYQYKFQHHLRIAHTTERPFNCSYCDTAFKCKATKVQHEKAVHFGIRYKDKKVYSCQQDGCDRRYKTRKSWKRHVENIHLGIRYPCEYCGQVFRRIDTYQRHVRVVHTECPTMLECKPCNRTYTSRPGFLAHLKKKRHLVRSRNLQRRGKRGKEVQEDFKDRSRLD